MDSHKQKILDFIQTEYLCVVSTVNTKGYPESATVAFSETDNLEIIFQTPNNTRKYQNIHKNPNVSVVIGCNPEYSVSVQYEGIAREISESEREKYLEIHGTKNPKTKKYANIRENKLFLVTPKWIRFTRLNTEPEVFELNL